MEPLTGGAWRRLREKFPEEEIGLLPRSTAKGNPKGRCVGEANSRGDGRVCGKYHALPAIHLDYVGHAFVNARLIDVAGNDWAFEPVLGEDGLPVVRDAGSEVEVGAYLEIGGVRRFGVGTAAKTANDRLKKALSDALRNAAMRHGIALSMWQRAHYEEDDEEEQPRFTSEDHLQGWMALPERPVVVVKRFAFAKVTRGESQLDDEMMRHYQELAAGVFDAAVEKLGIEDPEEISREQALKMMRLIDRD